MKLSNQSSLPLLMKVIFICILLYSGKGWCLDQTIWTKNSWEWLNNNYSYVMQEIKNKDSKLMVPIMNTVGYIWIHRDGALWVESTHFMLHIIHFHPDVFFKWFYSNQDSYQIWLDKAIGEMYFSALDSKQMIDVEVERLNAIHSLKNYIEKTKHHELKKMARDLENKLQTVEFRMVM